jgi:hypothetical protein
MPTDPIALANLRFQLPQFIQYKGQISSRVQGHLRGYLGPPGTLDKLNQPDLLGGQSPASYSFFHKRPHVAHCLGVEGIEQICLGVDEILEEGIPQATQTGEDDVPSTKVTGCSRLAGPSDLHRQKSTRHSRFLEPTYLIR